MQKVEADQTRLARLFEAALNAQHPNRTIIEAFRPVVLEGRRLSATPALAGADVGALDARRFKAGEPLGSQMDLLAGTSWEGLVLALVPAMREGFPALGDDLERLRDYLRQAADALSRIMHAPAAERQADIEQTAARAGIDVQVLGFVLATLERIALAGRAAAWGDRLAGFAWDRGYCPICGGAPMLARIEEGIPRRWLHCCRCGHAWEFSRVICPACANTDQKSMTYFMVEDQNESTFTCEHCKHYLITITKIGDLAEFDAEVAALSLVHLDVLMQEQGYRPMALTAWNSLD